MRNSIKIILLLFVGLGTAQSQELNCNIKINAQQVQTQERQIFDNMEQAIANFMNTTKWTDEDFEEQEKIKCDILITLNKGNSITNFSAVVQIKSMRPIYGTDYNSPVLNFFDNNWVFEYNPSQPLIFAENTYSTELTSLLAYYASIVIGLDFDTFSPEGGSPYYERALNILNNSQTGGRPGWNGIGGDVRDRYWIITNLNSPQFSDFRQGLYDYHRNGLDVLTDQPEEARQKIITVLENVKKVRNQQPTSVTLNAFFDAKNIELANLFSIGDAALRQKASELLIQLDPTNAATYRKLAK